MQGGTTEDRAVQQVYIVVLTIPMVLVVALWAVLGLGNVFRAIVTPVVLVLHGTLVAGLVSGRLATQAVGPWVVISPAVILAARLVTWEVVPASRPDDFGLVVTAFAWFGTLAALAFLVFGTRRGALISLVASGVLYLAALWSAVAGMMADRGSIGVVIFMAAGHTALIGVVWVLARNVEQLAEARARSQLLELQATTDPVTDVANRRRLDDELQRLVAQSRRYGQPVSAVLVDLDQFKTINDVLGHDVGDQVLVIVARQLQGTVRGTDLLGRWGGDEFLILTPQADQEAACALAERCRDVIARSATHGGKATITASFGVATLGPDDDARSLMRRADLALYTAKSEGRNRVVAVPDFTSPLDPAITDRIETRPPEP